MGLIERAARRIEELRRTGVEIPPAAAAAAEGGFAPSELPAPPPPAPREAAEPVGPRPPLLKLDLVELEARGFVTSRDPKSRIAEEFRVIKRPVLANAAPDRVPRLRHGNLVMVTSALPGEGKSFTALNLAMSLALEPERSVLLVDGDVVRPSLPRMLGVDPLPGLLDVLGKPALGLERFACPTNVERLSFLASGRPDPSAAEALTSEVMKRLLEDLATRHPHRIVVFDTPPLLVTTESRALASRMGQVIFVVDAQRSTKSDVQRALGMLEDVSVKLMLLNKATGRGGVPYGYGYGYGYGE